MSDALESAYASRKGSLLLARALSSAAVILAFLPLASVVMYVLVRGGRGLWTVLTQDPSFSAARSIALAALGTAQIVALASLLAIPLGLLAGTFLAEARDRTVARAARFVADVLAGVPSLLIGVVVYAFVVVPMGGFSALAGAIALALVMLPGIARTTDELVRSVPDGLREAALTLGASRWRTTLGIVLRTAAPGIRTACVLAIARALGETAPLLFTVHGSRDFGGGWLEPTPSLQVQIFTQTMTSSDEAHSQAWAAAFVLFLMIGVIHVGARRFARRTS
jgi:phosphate transport system permease protein